MAYPSIEEVVRQMVLQFQNLLGPEADVYAAGKKTAIEVVAPGGEPVEEVQNKPKLAIVGPVRSVVVETMRKPRGIDVKTGENRSLYTFDASPYPQFYDMHFTVIGWSMRESDAAGRRGTLWLMNRVMPFCEGTRIKGTGTNWIADRADWPGYYMEWTTPPAREAGGEMADLFMFTGEVKLIGVRVTERPDSTGPTISPDQVAVDIDDLDALVGDGTDVDLEV